MVEIEFNFALQTLDQACMCSDCGNEWLAVPDGVV